MDKRDRLIAKILCFFLIFIICFLFSKKLVFAEEKISQSSAALASQGAAIDERQERLRQFLEFYHSPLAPYSSLFVEVADQYSLDWKLLPAISGVETGFGNRAPFNSFNAYGWNNGHYYFKSWKDGIESVAQTLKENYIDKGAKTVKQIGIIYASSPFWAQRVAYFMKEIESFNSPSTLQLTL